MYEYRQIIIQMRLGYKDRQIARDGLAGRKKCGDIRTIAQSRGWLNPNAKIPNDDELEEAFSGGKAKYPQSSVVQYHNIIKQYVECGHTATIIYRCLVHKHSFAGSYTAVQSYVFKNFKENATYTVPLTFAVGESAQVDFGKGPLIFNSDTNKMQKSWFFLMVLGYSRHMYAEIIWHQDVETWIGCHIRAFKFFNGMPRKIIIDNAKCAIIFASKTDPIAQRGYYDFASEMGFCISACAPRDPKKKGRVEAGVKYLKKAFFPLRNFKDITDANIQLKSWILGEAGNRKHGSTGKAPLTEFTELEQTILIPLPDAIPEVAIWKQVKVYNDCHVRFQKVMYSTPYKHVREIVWLRITETTIKIYLDHKLIAAHCRNHKENSYVTIDSHLPPNARGFLSHGPTWCKDTSEKIGPKCSEVIQALLADKVIDRLKSAQSILNLKNKYSPKRLELACNRAIVFNCIEYKAIKDILKKGIEYDTIEETEAFDMLSKAYTSGKYYRDFSNDIH